MTRLCFLVFQYNSPIERTFNSRITKKDSTLGLTLPELLVAILVSSVIAIAAGAIVLDNIRITSKQDSILRLQENWNRIQFLIDQDMAEGSGSCFSGSTLTIYGVQGSGSNIIYSLVNNNLQRQGPRINSSGALDLSTNDTDIVADYVSTFEGSAANDTCSASNPSQRIAYTLGLEEVRDGQRVSLYTNQGNVSSGYSRVDKIN
jgi:hypothetical protein